MGPRSGSHNFHIRYLKYLERYNVMHNGGQSDRKPSMGFRVTPWPLTLDDIEH